MSLYRCASCKHVDDEMDFVGKLPNTRRCPECGSYDCVEVSVAPAESPTRSAPPACPVCGNEERQARTGLWTCECPAVSAPLPSSPRQEFELALGEGRARFSDETIRAIRNALSDCVDGREGWEARARAVLASPAPSSSETDLRDNCERMIVEWERADLLAPHGAFGVCARELRAALVPASEREK